MCTRQPTRTIILKSPDSDNIREIIVTPVLFNKSQEGRLPVFNQMDCSLTERMNRKRRLEHLSLEEKILRKKLKNREAAQTSRDRKKARLDYLEETVKKLREENETLYEEVSSLRSDVDGLTKENTELRDEVWRLSVGNTPEGPAVSTPLLQGKMVSPALRLQLLLVLLNFSLTNGIGLTRPQPNPTWTNLKSLQIHYLLNRLSLSCETEPSPMVGTSTEHVESETEEEKNGSPMPCSDMCVDDDKTVSTHLVSEQTIYTPEEFMLPSQVCTNNDDLIFIEDAVEEVVCLTEEDDCNFHIKEENMSDLIKVESADISISDDSISDHGYESVDSPLSEPDYVTHLFPDLI